MAQIDEDFSRPTTEPSGIDWSAILRTVTDRYGDRVWLLKDTLEKRKQPSANVTEIASQARLQVLVMVTPYLVYRSISTNDRLSGDTEDKEWLQLVTSHCASSLTAGIRPSTLTRSERLIKQSIDGVLSRICSTLTGILGDALSSSIISDKKAGELLEVWGQRVGDLVSWLDWPMWHTCRPACPAQMYCYIYTWPFDVPWGDVPFPPGYAATVHFYWPDKGIQLLGMLSNDKPSAIFRVRGSFGTSKPSHATHQLLIASTQSSGTTAQLGIAIEPIEVVMNQVSSLPPPNKPVTDPSTLAEKIGKHLVNYLSGFGEVAPGGQMYVPMSAVTRWYDNFVGKIKSVGISFLERQD
ncbi:hypothetical protein FRC17_007130 [Serendipita sp. 399]|nr:hypothetical protein FRC17_007130 [Serendipita sp. 399]